MPGFRTDKPFGLIVAAIWLASCGGDAGQEAVEAPDELGSFAIGHTVFTVVDEQRDDRRLKVDVWYPVDQADATDGPFSEYVLEGPFTLTSEVAVDDLPVSSEQHALLVFSHGFGGINTQSTQLMETLASHGFVVAAPEHTGNTAVDSSDDMPAEKRVPDVSVVIDRMFERASTAGDAFEGRIDESKVGVLGHSFGGSTALGMVAGFAGAGPDLRVKAIGVIAGGVGPDNFSEEALASVTAPTIFLVGTLDTNAVANHNYAFEHMPNAEALFKVEITGANHTHFANVCAIGDSLLSLGLTQDQWPSIGAEALIQPYNDTCTEDVFPISEAHRLEDLYMVAHFKRYLLGQLGYDRHLSSRYAEENEPAVSFVAR
jgi:predicted dienelactone hydrolase